jgi:molybdopterin adenylyltransferase
MCGHDYFLCESSCTIFHFMQEAESTRTHKSLAPARVGVAVLVISTSVSEGRNEDRSGGMIREMCAAAGHDVVAFQIVPDDARMITEAVRGFLLDSRIHAVISTGGTGLTKTDVTVETLRPLFSKELTGFTPLFMQLSYADVGPACMLSRATAGIVSVPLNPDIVSGAGRPDIPVVERAVLFALPGSPKAVTLALEKLILPELAHITKHFREK